MPEGEKSVFVPPVRDDLVGQHPYGAPVLDVPVRLNVNENPYPPSPALVAALGESVRDVAASLNRYPDRDAVALRRALADYLGHGLETQHVWAANGSNEVMAQLFLLFGGPGRRSLTFTPTYSMYPQYARDSFTEHIEVPMGPDMMLKTLSVVDAIERHRPALVLIASPNNPTGVAAPLETIAAAERAAAQRGGMVIVDEAYAEFRRDTTPSALTLLPDHTHLVVTRTMSKAFGFAGARVGYLAAHPATVAAVQLVRLPYHLSAVTQAVARTALSFSSELLAQVDALREQRDALSTWLAGRGLEVPESDANFLLVGKFPDRDLVWRSLVDQGVLIRQTGPDHYLRMSVGTPAENDALRQALDVVLTSS